jgi:hypothetical protein
MVRSSLVFALSLLKLSHLTVIVIIIACFGTVARGIDTERFVKFDGMLDTLLILYSLMIPGFLKVITYAKQCLRKIQVGRINTILQLKCPVKKKNAAGESISLALGGNIPDKERWSICTVRCADQLFGGKENLEKFFIFNLRVTERLIAVQSLQITKARRLELCLKFFVSLHMQSEPQ